MTSDVEALKKRNERVEADKAWETSWTRKVVVALGTYIIIGGYLSFLEIKDAWLHALVPAIAYVISTLTMPVLRNFWISHIYRKSMSGL